MQILNAVERECKLSKGWANFRIHFICSYFHSKLLERDSSKRLCCKPHGEGFQELQWHPWFKPIDWESLENKTQTPPFVPDVRFITSLRLILVKPWLQAKKANFDASYELEELLLEDNPLKAKQRKANQDNLSAEMRQMEDQYVVYMWCLQFTTLHLRFTPYDFKKMMRRSYYPNNQQLISMATATSSGLVSSRPETPPNELRVENARLRVEGSDMMLDPSMMYKNSNDMELRASADETTTKENDITRVDPAHMEKTYS